MKNLSYTSTLPQTCSTPQKISQKSVETISELQKKISKDNANIKGLGEKSSDIMNCWNCGTQMIWGGDHSFEDVGLDGEGIASNFSCPNCSAHADFYVSMGEI